MARDAFGKQFRSKTRRRTEDGIVEAVNTDGTYVVRVPGRPAPYPWCPCIIPKVTLSVGQGCTIGFLYDNPDLAVIIAVKHVGRHVAPAPVLPINFGLWPCPEAQPTVSLGVQASAAYASDALVTSILDLSVGRVAGGFPLGLDLLYNETDPVGLVRYDLAGESFLGVSFLRYDGMFTHTGTPVFRLRNLGTAVWSSEVVMSGRTCQALGRVVVVSGSGGEEAVSSEYRPARRQGHAFFMPTGSNDGLIVVGMPSLGVGKGFAVWRHSAPTSQLWVPFVTDSVLDVADEYNAELGRYSRPIARGSSLSVADRAVLEGSWAWWESADSQLANPDRGRVHLHRISQSGTLSAVTTSLSLPNILASAIGPGISRLYACGLLDTLPVKGEDLEGIAPGYQLSIPSTRWPHTGVEKQPEFWLQASASILTPSPRQFLATVGIDTRTGAHTVRNVFEASSPPEMINPGAVSADLQAPGETGSWSGAPTELGPANVVGYLQLYWHHNSDTGEDTCVPRNASFPFDLYPEAIGGVYEPNVGATIPATQPFPIVLGSHPKTPIHTGVTKYTGEVKTRTYPLSNPVLPMPLPLELVPGDWVNDNQGPNSGHAPAGAFGPKGQHYTIFAEPYPVITGLEFVGDGTESRVLETQEVSEDVSNGPCESFHYENPEWPTRLGRVARLAQRHTYQERYRTLLRSLDRSGLQKFRVQIGKRLNLGATVSGSSKEERGVEQLLNWWEWAVRGPHLWALHLWPRGLDSSSSYDIPDWSAAGAYNALLEPHLSRFDAETGQLVDRVSLRPTADSGNDLVPVLAPAPHMILGSNSDGHHAAVWTEWDHPDGTRHNEICLARGATLSKTSATTSESAPPYKTVSKPTLLESTTAVAADGQIYYLDNCNAVKSIALT